MVTSTMQTDKPNTNFKKSVQVADLKNRVEAAHPLLPRNYKKIIAERYPEYNSMEGASKISNVISGRSTCETTTKILEEIAEEYKPKQA